MSEAPNPAPAPAPDPAPAPAGNPWYHGADEAVVGFIQSKGWHDKPANEAAIAAVTSYREAQQYIGVPPDRVIKLPENLTDPDGMKPVWGRLGVPEKPEGYDFSSIVDADTKQPLLDEQETTWLRGVAHKLNIPAGAATQLAQELLAHNVEIEGTEAAANTAALAEEHKVLDTSWGANKEANTFLAKRGAEKLGLDATAVDALEKVQGYAKTMEALRRVGELAGEARFVNSSNPAFNDGIMTREQAQDRKSTLMKDEAWVNRYNSGDAAAAKEMLALNTIIVGDDTEASRR